MPTSDDKTDKKSFWAGWVTFDDKPADAPASPAVPAPSSPARASVLAGPTPSKAFRSDWTGPTPTPSVPVPTVTPSTAMEWSLDDVFRDGGAATGKNSAETAIKLRDSLATFPETAQLAMVRAMDAADDSWTEADVLADAQKRVTILGQYSTLVDADENKRVAAAHAASAEFETNHATTIAKIDANIASLQADREHLVQEIAQANALAEEQANAVKVKAGQIRELVANAVARYQAVLKFFGK